MLILVVRCQPHARRLDADSQEWQVEDAAGQQHPNMEEHERVPRYMGEGDSRVAVRVLRSPSGLHHHMGREEAARQRSSLPDHEQGSSLHLSAQLPPRLEILEHLLEEQVVEQDNLLMEEVMEYLEQQILVVADLVHLHLLIQMVIMVAQVVLD